MFFLKLNYGLLKGRIQHHSVKFHSVGSHVKPCSTLPKQTLYQLKVTLALNL